LSLALAASCTTPRPSDPCAGWSFIDGQDASLVWLAAHDPLLLRAVIAHDEFGQSQGCWK
jgi:hypothetical protein